MTSNATTSPALLTNIQWVVKPRGDRAWRKAYAMFEQQYQSDSEPQVSSCYRSNYCPPKGSDANLPRLPKSSTAPQFKNTKWVVRPKSNSAWKKARISFAQREMTSNVSNKLAKDEAHLTSSNSPVKFFDVPASGTSDSETTGAGAPLGPGAQ